MTRAGLIAAATMVVIAVMGPGPAAATPAAPNTLAADIADLGTDLQALARQQKFKGGGGGGNRNANRGGGNRQNANRGGNNNRNNANRNNNNRQNNNNFNNNRNRNNNVNVRVNVRPVRAWGWRPYYGTVIGGVALGTIIAASAIPVVPAPGLCWYWADSSQTRGYWDYCA